MNSLPTYADDRGLLTVFESIPFEVKRVFWIYNVPKDQSRAGHSHEICEQCLIAVSGKVSVFLDGALYRLNDPTGVLYVPVGTMIRLFNFTEDAVLLVLASEKYDPSDNIV